MDERQWLRIACLSSRALVCDCAAFARVSMCSVLTLSLMNDNHKISKHKFERFIENETIVTSCWSHDTAHEVFDLLSICSVCPFSKKYRGVVSQHRAQQIECCT